MKLIIVGASGYIGKLLLEKSKTICETIGTSTKGGDGLYPLDLENVDAFDYSLIEEGDAIILTAAISAPDICANRYDYAYGINVTGTAKFIRRAIEIGANILFFSSDTVYGSNEVAFEEMAQCNPVGEYGIMKHDLEKQFLGNAKFKTARLSYVMSKYDKFTKYLTSCAQNNQEADIFHPFCRSMIYRDDVIDGAIKIAITFETVAHQVINFGGPKMVSRLELAEEYKNIVAHNLLIKITEPNDDFFKHRPRFINMKSEILQSILGHDMRSLSEALLLDFSHGELI